MTKRSTFFLLTFVLILWGSAFPAIRAALEHYSPTHLASLRFLIASIALGAICWKQGFPKLDNRDIPLLLLNGVVGVGFYNLFLNTGQQTVDSGSASLLVNTAPIWTVLWAVIFLKERPNILGWLGLVVSFLGVGFIALRHGRSIEINRGAFLVLGASVAHSIYIVLMKRNVAKYGAVAATTLAVWVGTLFLLFFSKGLLTTIREAPWQTTGIVVYLGLFPAAAAYLVWSFVLKRLPASRAVSFLYFVPVTAFLIGWLWLGETPTWTTLIGGLLIVAGVALVNRASAEQNLTHGN